MTKWIFGLLVCAVAIWRTLHAATLSHDLDHRFVEDSVDGVATFTFPDGPHSVVQAWCDAPDAMLLTKRAAVSAGSFSLQVMEIKDNNGTLVIVPYLGSVKCYAICQH